MKSLVIAILFLFCAAGVNANAANKSKKQGHKVSKKMADKKNKKAKNKVAKTQKKAAAKKVVKVKPNKKKRHDQSEERAPASAAPVESNDSFVPPPAESPEVQDNNEALDL